MSLQIYWQFIQRTVPVVGNPMVPIEESLRETFFPMLFFGGGGDYGYHKILVNIINHGSLDIPLPHLSEGSAHIISKAACG